MGTESKRTVSRCVTEVEDGTHAFEIVGYSLKRGIGVGKFVRSGTFAVGGHHWAIRFYPDGIVEDSKDYVSVYLELMGTSDAEARAAYTLGFVKRATGKVKIVSSEDTRVFKANDDSRFAPRSTKFMLRSNLEGEASGYIEGDCLTIECEIDAIKETLVSETMGCSEIEVPPSELSDHFGRLLVEDQGRDVAFSVGAEAFAAHRIVLAARSPVFKAELYGEMRESTDRYAMDRLKLMCQSILRKHLHVENVVSMLALADQHNCGKLKDVCVEFIASEIDAMDTEGYENLKKNFPSVLVRVLEKTSRFNSRYG
ncbi:hypothetical protein E2562_039230 [Oryza meyeriana var. granulata]|uniref:MATH domain-containing protein n=1 Tax=Oryza meyeriana var. granulata TaxID=110450 RepID=A0A6G1CNC8_9ORYZ|nr:hypothetical protein E2562_039230 [Oryza meyeriana var. granulata]KAF0901304.1 hypothetical protein E2562_039230 [Oryza meyeriana var. granulata]